MGRWWSLGTVGCASVAFAMMHVAACGLDVDGTANTTVDATADQIAIDVHVPDNFVPVTDGSVDVLQPDVSMPDGGPIDSSPPDASPPDSGPPDAAPCSAFLCGSTCVNSCVGCAFGTAQCNSDRVCLSDCSTCSTTPFTCYTCTGGAMPFGLCQATKCQTPDPMACPCDGGDAAACPGVTQVCKVTGGGSNGICQTCGQGGTDMKQCANGLTCDDSTGVCR